MTIRLLTLLLLGVVLPSQSPQSVADELLAADRAASVAGAKTTVIPALTAMFAPDVAMQAPVVGFARGLAAATEALRGNPDNIDGRIEWLPVRSGIAADGLHGFTFGFMTLRRPDGTTVPVKYLAYWVKRDGRWEVAAYKRRLGPAGDVNTTVLAPSLPAQLQPVASDAATLAGHRQSLIAAEQAFSDEAQMIGIGAAFAKYGSADAMNMGGPNDAIFVMGADAIGKAVGGTEPSSTSPVNWSADSAIVASSGDLGVTFGYIRQNAPAGTSPAQPPVPFFTIWRRANPTAPWRYVAE
ncbi:MAG: nuclear transport factor 2 family protein [Acidobacteria bacterium]|jgi:ketosteroid isomerase-like protein|nr:nuclear transport factor 2 family protein [Acidobacteriota bacterium]